jgi:hypothetical protein
VATRNGGCRPHKVDGFEMADSDDGGF